MAIYLRVYQVTTQLCGVKYRDLFAQAEQSVLIAATSVSFPYPCAVLFEDIPHVALGAFGAFGGVTFHGAADCTPVQRMEAALVISRALMAYAQTKEPSMVAGTRCCSRSTSALRL